jgi:hypothetical protein
MSVTAVAWWAIVFAAVVRSGYLTWPEAAGCLAARTSTCELAMSLCLAANRHLFGVTRYAPDLLWVGLSLLFAQIVLLSPAGGTRAKADPGSRKGARR